MREPNYFNFRINHHPSAEYYANLFPKVSISDDILFEKTPDYFAYHKVPSRVKTMYENYGIGLRKYDNYTSSDYLKFVVVLCNPSLRVFSDYMHNFERGFALKPEVKKQIFAFGSFDEYVKQGISELTNLENEFRSLGGAKNSLKFLSNNILAKINSNDTSSNGPVKARKLRKWHLITKSIYSEQLKNWLKYFPDLKNQYIFLNGAEILSNPGKILKKFQEAVDLPVEIDEKSFVRNESTGFFCLDNKANLEGARVKLDTETGQFCMGSMKGRTRSSDGKSKISDEAKNLLDNYFRRFNNNLYELIGEPYILDW